MSDLDTRLRDLPPLDAPPDVRVKVREVALRELERARDPRAATAWGRIYTRFVEPALVAAATASYLAWALQAAAALYR